MPTALLGTKLFLPRPRRGLVPRPRLSDRLANALGAKLVLVSAPAGFGKTTLLVDWVAQVSDSTGVSVAWLSLDAGDNDPATFWSYVIAALRTATPGVGEQALGLLQEPQPPPIQQVLTTLLNELGGAASDCLLVLDDYHAIESAEIHSGVQFLLDHLPQTLRLVIASRADPALALPRLRARGDLVEIRAADLRFTPEEAASYLNGSMGFRLAPDDVSALEGRTEGWIAALQLAALSMSGRDDVSSFIAGFAGDDRYVVDYLVEEVLDRQPAPVREFLLQTSVLDRMTGALCDALTGGDDGRAVLESLDRGNLFVVPLDDRRQWYRYHHLFADVLKARLLDERPEHITQLHRRACGWYEQQGQRGEAIRHAMAGEDHGTAATLIELAVPDMRRDRREATLRSWLEALPDEVLRNRPVLCHTLAGSMMSTGTFDGADELLDATERMLEGGAPGTVVVDQEEYARLPAGIAMHRAGLALVRGEIDSSLAFSRQVLELAQEDDHVARGAASALTGLAAWRLGDLGTAQSSYATSVAEFEAAGYVADVLGCSIHLGDMEVIRGHPRAAMRTYERALALADRSERLLRGTVDMYVGRAGIHRELGDLAAAKADLDLAREPGEPAGLPQNAYRWRMVLAQVCEAEGDLETAVALLDEAEPLYDGDFSPDVRPIAALRARLWARHGFVDEALSWAAQHGLTATDDLGYLHEFEHVTLARVLVARHDRDGDRQHLDQAIELLRRLLDAAREGNRNGSVLEIRVVEALAQQARGDLTSATSALEDALQMAEPEGHVRTFLDEGAPMQSLLAAAAEGGSAYAKRLLTAHGEAPRRPAQTKAASALVEPLSAREREVLRLLGTDLNGPEIARELVVSLNTVRTHTKNLYTKLGVNNRRAALRRAKELDLL